MAGIRCRCANTHGCSRWLTESAQAGTDAQQCALTPSQVGLLFGSLPGLPSSSERHYSANSLAIKILVCRARKTHRYSPRLNLPTWLVSRAEPVSGVPLWKCSFAECRSPLPGAPRGTTAVGRPEQQATVVPAVKMSKSTRRKLRKEKYGALAYQMSEVASKRQQANLIVKPTQFGAESLSWAEGAYVGVNLSKKRFATPRTKEGLLRRGYTEIAWQAK